jgi:hypothetical protein
MQAAGLLGKQWQLCLAEGLKGRRGLSGMTLQDALCFEGCAAALPGIACCAGQSQLGCIDR